MPTISIIGDSQGGGLTQLGRFADALRAKGWTPARFWYRNGASTRRLIEDLPEILRPGAIPDAVLVVAGGNDSTASAPDWQTMLVQLRSRGVRRIYWIGPPAAVDNQTLDVARDAVSRLQQQILGGQSGVTWISGRATAQGLPRRDEVHLTAEGYGEWARRLATQLDSSSGRGLVTLALAAGALGLAWWGSKRLA